MEHNIISFSGGKDSTRLAHLMIDLDINIHSAVWYVTPWEFPEMHDHIKMFEQKTGIMVVRLYPKVSWDDLIIKYKWPSIGREWCTARKTRSCNQYISSVGGGSVEYIGFSADEKHRAKGPEIKKKNHKVKFPLIEYGITEKQALQDCYSMGYNWGGLYDIYNRVSCFCCPKKGTKGLRKLRKYRPKLYEEVLRMDSTIVKNGGFGTSRKTVHDFEKTFCEDDRQMDLFPGFENISSINEQQMELF